MKEFLNLQIEADRKAVLRELAKAQDVSLSDIVRAYLPSRLAAEEILRRQKGNHGNI